MLSNKISQSNTGVNQSLNSSGSSSVASGISSGINTAGLEKGQLIKGEVTDLRSNEVSVKMEDGKVLTGRLEDSANLSIGDKVVFRVEDVSLKSLTLKIIANTDFTNQDNTIDKALEAAGLSKNERNTAIVGELLKQQMSIDKNTISLIIRQSLQFKESSIQSLVLMNKLNIPVTENNVAQFDAYTGFKAGIMDDLKSFADSVVGYFNEEGAVSSSEFVKQGKELLTLLYGNETKSAVTYDTDLKLQSVGNTGMEGVKPQDSVFLPNTLPPDTVSPSNSLTQNLTFTLKNILSTTELTNLADMIEAEPSLKSFFSEEQLTNLRNGSAELKEIAQNLTLIKSQAEAAGPSSLNSTDFTAKAMQLINSLATETILSASQDTFTGREIGSFLNQAARSQLLHSLESFAQSSKTADINKTFEGIKAQISSGSILTSDILKWIHGSLGEVSDSSAKSLLTSDSFKSLLKEQLLSGWSLPPEEIGKGSDINKHYESLLNQLDNLKEFMEQSNKSSGAAISEQIGHLKDNINFMNQMNHLFTYIQIPLKMKNQYTDSQLYVYSRKKQGRSAEDGISVLLHLNMEHLGTMDVFIELKNNNLNSKFYMEDRSAVSLISSHINLLERTLEAKGYSFHSEVLPREKKVNIVQDFINKEAESAGHTRYNFDLRA